MSFVILEGPNGVGKTTIVNNLSTLGIKTLSSPNGTPLAKMLRPACRGTEPWKDIDKQIQFLLFSAARLDEYIRVVKDSKELVVADRWWTSTYVYQCCLEGFSEEFLEFTIHPNEQVNLVILLDGNEDIIIERLNKEREKNPTHGKCTWTQNSEITKKLIQLYRYDLPLYLKHRKINYITIDTTNIDVNEVQNLIMQEVGKRELIK